jgi:phospholipase/carboxylesterase
MTNLPPLLNCIEINPTEKALGSIILLHGLGADGNDFAPMVPQLNLLIGLPLRFVLPSAPIQAITINNGHRMPAWYDIGSFDLGNHADKKGIAHSVAQIKQLIEHEEQQGTPRNKIVLAGFSQGAVIALTTSLNLDKPPAGVLALSGYLPYAEEAIAKSHSAHKLMPIFIAHGVQDNVVPYFLGNQSYQLLIERDFNVESHSYQMQHNVCLEEIQDIAKWLKKVFS